MIELDPGRAFGTGSHPTTSLCVDLMEEKITVGETVLDVGTGSGILMIVAEKLGQDLSAEWILMNWLWKLPMKIWN